MPPRNSDKNKEVLKELEKTISPVLVVNNSSLKPYVELFEYAPENIYQQPLGSLVGFFEVKEYSDESAYVVNFLTSVLKKEYYVNPKRPVTESLDSALHKVNMALSELAKHGNVEWLGKIHAAICVLEKNNAHFSVSGDAKIFLYRNQNISEISEDLASDALEPHPLKTFVNVSSGRLEKNDRLLITSGDIFHILSITEIKKNFQRFEGDKFVQFLKTALSNQMEMIASMVVEMSEAAPVTSPKKSLSKKTDAPMNAFSQQTFAGVKTAENLSAEKIVAGEEIIEENEYIDKKTGHIYVQGETNENDESPHGQANLYWDVFKEKISQSTYVTKNEIRKRFSLYKKQLAKKRKLRKIEKEKRSVLEAEEKKLRQEQREIEEQQRELELFEEQRLEEIRLAQEKIEQEKLAELEQIEQEKLAEIENINKANLENYGVAETIQEAEEIKSIPTKKEKIPKTPVIEMVQPDYEKMSVVKIETNNRTIADIKTSKVDPVETSRKNREMSFLEKLRQAQTEEETKVGDRTHGTIDEISQVQDDTIHTSQTIHSETKNSKNTNRLNPRIETFKLLAAKTGAKTAAISRKALQLSKTHTAKLKTKLKNSKISEHKLVTNITPHFSKIGRLYRRLTRQQKISSAAALVLIFIVPLFITHYLNQPKPVVETPKVITPPTEAELLANEKNINTNIQTQSIYSNSNIVSTLIANDTPVIVTKSSVVVLQGAQPKEYSLPADFGTPIRAAFMSDLSLVFIVSDKNKVTSFSPTATKFSDNKIDLSGIAPSSFIGTYLTYLYALNQKSNQIYRYPRAEGGFGDRASWLKDGTSLTDVTDMTIDDNIYAIADNQILKFFKGQKQPFMFEASKTPVHYDKIYTTPDLQAIYILDTQNSRIVQYGKDGTIIKQYYNVTLKNGISITVSEKNKAAYITTSEGLLSITIQ